MSEKRKTAGKKTGRKKIDIDIRTLDKLCEMQCTIIEIAGFFNVSVDTIERRVKEASGIRFADYFEEKRGAGRASLRRRQFQLAMKGNGTMLVWLGKQYLGQTDKQEVKQEGSLNVYTMTSDERKARIAQLLAQRDGLGDNGGA
ncbi:MAG: hypothetical protein PHD37_17345 [Gallionellaceae bacterium]|nr:hypothetical protein [Gallionellaceae bacterium]